MTDWMAANEGKEQFGVEDHREKEHSKALVLPVEAPQSTTQW